MRLFEVVQGHLPKPATHSILAIVEVKQTAWVMFREFLEHRPELELLGRCAAPHGKLTVFVGCTNDGVRLRLENVWHSDQLARTAK